nr:hypothetical protein [Pseudodesulfovibrio sp.]
MNNKSKMNEGQNGRPYNREELIRNRSLFCMLIKEFAENGGEWIEWKIFEGILDASPRHTPRMYGYQEWWPLLAATEYFEREIMDGKLMIRAC